MRNSTRLFKLAGVLWSLQGAPLGAEGLRDRLEGLVFEVEEWSQPTSAWLKNKDTPDRWNLWTTEVDVLRKRSMGASLRSPTVRQDRRRPEDGAPPLHTQIRGIPAGTYRVYVNNPGRYIAYSLDGREWHRGQPRAEIFLGVFDIRDGIFELWADDRFATAWNIGPCYYDYIRMEPYVPPELMAFQAHRLPDGRVQVSWISSEPVDTGTLEAHSKDAFRPVAESAQRAVRNHRVWAEGWRAGRDVRLRVRARLGPRYVFTSRPVQLKVPLPPPARGPRPQMIALRLASLPFAERPMLAGVPLRPAHVWQANQAWVEDSEGPVPAQVNITARWPDGSAKWLFVRFLPTRQASRLHLRTGDEPPESPNPIRIERDKCGLMVENGPLRLRLRQQTFALLEHVEDRTGVEYTAEPVLGNVHVVDATGRAWSPAAPDRLEFEEAGPVRAVVRAEGAFQTVAGERSFRYRLRYFITARSPLVRVQLTLINDASSPAHCPLSSFAIRVALAGQEPLRGELGGSAAGSVERERDLELQQVTHKCLRLTVKGRTSELEAKSAGWAVAERGPLRVAVAVRDFWQTWPKGLAIAPDGIHVRILPELAEDEYRPGDITEWARHLYWFDKGRYLVKRGMALRTEFWVRFDRSGSAVPLNDWHAWARELFSLPYAGVSPELYCESGAFGPLEPAGHELFAEYEGMVERNVAAVSRNREEKAEYGWLNFGDWYGERGFNWGNSEYDLAWAMAVQFARTGRWDYFECGEQMARHYSTVDTVHVPWAADMPGRAYAHSLGHVGVGVEPSALQLHDEGWDAWLQRYQFFFRGAIDAGGHVHEEGNLAYYFLTGDRDYLATAEMVVGAQAAYLTRQFDFRIERSAGWPLINAVAAYEATNNPFCLNAARLYVERILEKQDPVEGGWLLPQNRSECDHPPPHLGGKSFATGVLLYGLMRYNLIEPREDVKRAILQACGWLVEQAWNPSKQGFRYKTGCDRYADSADSGATAALCIAPLAYGWQLTKDPRFRDVLLISFTKMCEHTGSIGKAAAMLTRQSAYALPVLRQIKASPAQPTTTQAAEGTS